MELAAMTIYRAIYIAIGVYLALLAVTCISRVPAGAACWERWRAA